MAKIRIITNQQPILSINKITVSIVLFFHLCIFLIAAHELGAELDVNTAPPLELPDLLGMPEPTAGGRIIVLSPGV